jgi:hypothetical protein
VRRAWRISGGGGVIMACLVVVVVPVPVISMSGIVDDELDYAAEGVDKVAE